MTPPKVHNSTIINTNDSEMDKITDKEFKINIIRMIKENK
jgi:hypothetical protein